MTRVIITGSRDWYCPEVARAVLARLMSKYGPELAIIHGDCPSGVDKAFDEVANDLGLSVQPHPADWQAHGRAAGPKRNRAMVDAGAALCVAVSRNIQVSKGTAGCARLAIAAGIPTCLVSDDSGEPEWITEV